MEGKLRHMTRWGASTADTTDGQHDGQPTRRTGDTKARHVIRWGGKRSRILLDKKILCDVSLRFTRTVLRFIRKNSDYRGNFIIGESEESSVNGLHRFYYESSDYRSKLYMVGSVLRKNFGITGSSVHRSLV